MRPQRVTGLVLVLSGAALVTVFQLRLPTAIAPALAGAVLLGLFAATRTYGYLLPGGALTGLGIGLMLESARDASGATATGLGAGFLFVSVTDHLAAGGRSNRWWPLLAGVLLVAVGAAQYAGSRGWLVTTARWWPLLLVLAGVWRFVRQLRRRPGDTWQRS